VSALQTQVDTLTRLPTAAAADIDALIPAIVDKAFKGEL